MRKQLSILMFAVFIIGSCATASSGAEPNLQMTDEWYNGRLWLGSTSLQRGSYVIGYFEGFRAGVSAIAAITKDKIQGTAVIHRYIPGGTYGETVQAVDRFYEDPLNARIPISWALYVTVKRANGASAAEIDDTISSYRAYLAKEQK